MAVKLHRCSGQWVKIKAHPCWRVEKALMDMGVDYERVPGPGPKAQRAVLTEGTGQNKYPAIQFADGAWYREESKDMERTIRAGHLMDKDTGAAAAVAEPAAAAEAAPAAEPGPETPEVH
jgi:hypothetical protein